MRFSFWLAIVWSFVCRLSSFWRIKKLEISFIYTVFTVFSNIYDIWKIRSKSLTNNKSLIAQISANFNIITNHSKPFDFLMFDFTQSNLQIYCLTLSFWLKISFQHILGDRPSTLISELLNRFLTSLHFYVAAVFLISKRTCCLETSFTVINGENFVTKIVLEINCLRSFFPSKNWTIKAWKISKNKRIHLRKKTDNNTDMGKLTSIQPSFRRRGKWTYQETRTEKLEMIQIWILSVTLLANSALCVFKHR